MHITIGDDDIDVAKILTLGADDYITKPVRYKEMIEGQAF